MQLGTTDILVIGGGVIGLNLALITKRRHPDCKVTLLEKESECGLHASGRNSGVLHAGFYYTADSLKAKFTREGNELLTNYCLDRKLPIHQCGKLVVAKNADELNSLTELLKRGKANKVELYEISKKEAQEIEPRVRTYEKALFSPTTSSVDPKEVLNLMLQDAEVAGVNILFGTAYLGNDGNRVETSKGQIDAGFVINAAGLYADKIARNFGFSKKYQIIPFKGLYLISNEPKGSIKTNIYPVPNLKNPFLGVHFTITAHGKIKIGPTAIPAFWREHYKGFENFNAKEFFEIISQELSLFIRNDFNFRGLALQELYKYYKPRMLKLASELASGISKQDYTVRGPAGIRAQLFNLEERKLEMDFCFEGDQDSFHVLNAVSPAFTCSIPFTRYLYTKMHI